MGWLLASRRGLASESLLLVVGDSFWGSAAATRTRGRAAPAVLSALGVDALGLGHHDLERGLDRLSNLLADTEFPVVVSNAHFAGALGDIVSSTALLATPGGLRVGLVGVLPGNLDELVDPRIGDRIETRDPFEVVKELVEVIREKSDLLVVLYFF